MGHTFKDYKYDTINHNLSYLLLQELNIQLMNLLFHNHIFLCFSFHHFLNQNIYE